MSICGLSPLSNDKLRPDHVALREINPWWILLIYFILGFLEG